MSKSQQKQQIDFLSSLENEIMQKHSKILKQKHILDNQMDK
jgi:hypothetical protein